MGNWMHEVYPNVSAMATQLSRGSSVHEQQLILYAKESVKPAYEHLKGHNFFHLPEFVKFNQLLMISMDFVLFLY